MASNGLRRLLFVNWHALNGAAQGKRKLVLRANGRGTFGCPIKLCLHADFKSARGLRKHIENKHPWYFYFEEQPEINKEEIQALQPVSKRVNTASKPCYSMDEGIGKDFLDWLCTSCGGGKSQREAKQIAKRALKFLIECTGGNDSGIPLSNELVDCCLGSASIIIRFLTTLEKDWKLSFSSSLSYIKAITDLLDFRKSNGVTDSNLRCFTMTEVYLRRAKENLSKKKNLECTRNFDLETLIARDSWATLEEMERVIPFHFDNYKAIVEQCKMQAPLPTKQQLMFCTRFITTFLFLRVKCSRPMTFQFLTLPMIAKAKINQGFIDQTEFKTSSKYMFDTLIMDRDVLTVLDVYIDIVRPLFNPTCDYLLVSSTGSQYQSLTTAMTMLVHQAIGKYIHPTRYRQIVETASAERLTREEQEIISEDQKHSSTVAKVYYKKKQSRQVAIEGKKCMEKLIGNARRETDTEVGMALTELRNLSTADFDENVLLKSLKIINACDGDSQHLSTNNDLSIETSPYKAYSSHTLTKESVDELVQKTSQTLTFNHQTSNSRLVSNDLENEYSCDLKIASSSTKNPLSFSGTRHYQDTPICVNSDDSHDSKKKKTNKTLKNIKFTQEEDAFLLKGIQKYGKKNWASIFKDKNYQFHESRTRDSLRMRADSVSFKKLMT